MEGLRHPLNVENQFIGQAMAHKRKSYREVRNPLTGSLLERQIARAHYCIDHDCSDFIKWFEAETGMKPRDFIDKWERKRAMGG